MTRKATGTHNKAHLRQDRQPDLSEVVKLYDERLQGYPEGFAGRAEMVEQLAEWKAKIKSKGTK